MDTLEEAFEFESALVFGIGGSADIVGSLPTARFLESMGVETLLGGVAWEPVPYDTTVGPRSLDEVENVDRVRKRVGIATEETRTEDGIRFKEAVVADFLDCETALIDITGGVDEMAQSIERLCKDRDIDVVFGVDVGSDVLAKGDEPGVRSPVTDFYGLVTLDKIDQETCLGVFGYGSDGELTINEIEDGISRAARRDGLLGAWGITNRVRQELENLLKVIETQASRLPVHAARGEYGKYTIRGGEVDVRVTPPSVVTFYFDPTTVAASSDIASLIEDTETFDESLNALRDVDIQVEFDIGRDRLEALSK